MPDRLTTDIIDAELAPGARNAIRVCLRLQPSERITIITDEATAEIAAALQAEVEEVRRRSRRFRFGKLHGAPAHSYAEDHSG